MEDQANLALEEGARAEEAARERDDGRIEALGARLIEAEARAAALKMGVPEGRLKYALRLAGLSDLDAEAEDLSRRVEEAMRLVIEELPELAYAPPGGEAGGTTGSAGAFTRPGTPAMDGFARGFLA